MKMVMYGAGGHAAVVLDCLLSQGIQPAGLIDDATPDLGRSVFGIPVLGGREALPRLRSEGVTHVHIAIGDNGARMEAARFCTALGLELLSVTHETAVVSRRALLGTGNFIAAHAIVGPRARIGDCCILNHASSVDHDCSIGDAVHLAPGARLAGHVRVGPLSLIGIGAVVRDRVRVGERVTVGAGSVVVSELADDTVAFGVPARPRENVPGVSRP